MKRNLEQAVGRLRAGGRRITVQRRAVLQALADLGCAQGAEQIHARARRMYARLGIVTVYRTLDALTREGLVQAVHLGDGRVRYELTENGRHHHHLICLSCGTVERVEGCTIQPLEAAGRRRGFAVTTHRVELLGYCGRCQAPV